MRRIKPRGLFVKQIAFPGDLLMPDDDMGAGIGRAGAARKCEHQKERTQYHTAATRPSGEHGRLARWFFRLGKTDFLPKICLAPQSKPQPKSVAAKRRDQHARRVRSPELRVPHSVANTAPVRGGNVILIPVSLGSAFTASKSPLVAKIGTRCLPPPSISTSASSSPRLSATSSVSFSECRLTTNTRWASSVAIIAHSP